MMRRDRKKHLVVNEGDATSGPGEQEIETALLRRQVFSAVLIGGAVLPGTSSAVFGKSRPKNLDLMEFLLQEIQFRLANWLPPTEDSSIIEAWIKSTEAIVENLTLVAREAGVDSQIIDAFQKVRSIIDEYRQFLRDLDIFNLIRALDQVGTPNAFVSLIRSGREGYNHGYELGKNIAALSTAVTASAVSAVASSGASLLFGIAGSIQAEQDRATRDGISESAKRRRIASGRQRIENEFRFLDDISLSLQSRFSGLRAPRFNRLSEDGARVLQPESSPFYSIAQAHRLLRSDRVAAARLFVEFVRKVPTGVSQSPRAANYLASYYLIAGHILEFESRQKSDRALAVEAVNCFNLAQSSFRPVASNDAPIALPYQISRARASALSGQRDVAMAIASQLQRDNDMMRRANTNPDEYANASLAATAYDLAAVYSMIGNHTLAFNQLRQSYVDFSRRDPQALRDPLLSNLISANAALVREIANHPLVGTWLSQDRRSNYMFYSDGSLEQLRNGERLSGRWSVQGSNILSLIGRSIPDRTVRFSLSENTLTLDQDLVFVRQGSDGLLDGRNEAQSRSGRRLSADGSWSWNDRRPAEFARYTTSRSTDGRRRIHWYSYEDPSIGRITEVLSS